MLKLLTRWLNREKPPRRIPLSDFERIKHELRMCDVILVEGRSKISEIIRWVTNSPWTHAALYIGRLYDLEDADLQDIVRQHYHGDPGDRLIIESLLGRGTIIQSIDAYQADHLRICRPLRLSYKDTQQVIRYAVSQLGTDYNVRQVFDLMRFLLPWPLLPKKWASTLFLKVPGESTQTVCSTMIAKAFAYVQFPILPLVKQGEGTEVQLFRRNTKLCTPKDFDYSPYFDIIKYSFFDYYHAEYQLLPWTGSKVLSGDEADEYHPGDEVPDTESVETALAEAANKSTRRELPGEAGYSGD